MEINRDSCKSCMKNLIITSQIVLSDFNNTSTFPIVDQKSYLL
jgi:hypothetical protein